MYIKLVSSLRAYFRKIKRPGIGHSNKSSLFKEETVFLNLNQKGQKQLPIRGDSISSCPSGLSKCPFVKLNFFFHNFLISHIPRLFDLFYVV